jgi:lipopolysaccharide/colanic/teichoic acid biosynthesis glycosyltransferase
MEQATLQASQKPPRTDKQYKRVKGAPVFTEVENIKESVTANEEYVKEDYTATETETTNLWYFGTEKKSKLISIGIHKIAENWVDGISTLVKQLEHNYPAPEMIIADSQAGHQSISELRKFLNNHKQLSLIPFVVDERNMTEETKLRFRKERLADEIICLNSYDRNKLQAKARFLKKIKSNSQNLEWKRNIQTSAAVPSNGSLFKRAFDIIISSVALICLSPVFAIIALAIRLESRGPIFYIAKRAGRGYRIFNFYKFRTMVVDADKKMKDISHLNQYNASSEGPKFFKIENDPRITKVGAFLRKTSLDELPQFVNVLLGDMSLVGNRPLPLYEAATLTTDVWAERFMAPAGITGLWQITKRGRQDMSVEERIKLDIEYVKSASFSYDLNIMMRTPTALIQKTNV